MEVDFAQAEFNLESNEVRDVVEENSDDDGEDNEIVKIFGANLKKSADVKSKEEAIEETKRRAVAIAEMIAWKASSDPDADPIHFAMSSFVYQRIAKSMLLWNRSWRKASAVELCKTSFIDSYFQAINGCDFVKDVALASELFKLLMSITDCSPEASKLLAEKGIIPIIIRALADQSLRDKISNKFESRLLIRAVGSCHNVAKLTEYRPVFEDCGAFDVLTFYLADNNSTSKMQMSALCAMSFILSDKDASSLSDQFNIIPKLVKCLSKALTMKQRKANQGFSAEEIVGSLSNLAINDENKIKLVDDGILPLLVKMLTLNSLEKERAVTCLWRLAFNDEIRQKILAEKDCCDYLAVICGDASTEDDALKSLTKQALEFIQVGQKGLGSSSSDVDARTDRSSMHIFISYSWKQQEVVKRIKEVLVQRGYRTWLDLDQMQGSTLQSMASAVENAFLVLICYSDSYRTSNMCRTECEYVFKLQKPFIPINMQYRYQPDGWLGIVIGAKLYVDFSLTKHPFERVVENLFKEIVNCDKNGGDVVDKSAEKPFSTANNGNQVAQISVSAVGTSAPCQCCQALSAKVDRCCALVEAMSVAILNSQSPLRSSINDGSSSNRIAYDKIRSWSPKETASWMSTENLLPGNGSNELLSLLDGQALAGLYGIKSSAPDIYYRSVLQLCDESFPLCIRFTAALGKLFRD